MNEARPARFGPPIAVQLIGLLVGVLIVGQLTAFLVVTLLPPPRPPVYRVEEIATALKGGAGTPRYAPPLIRSVELTPPKARPGRELHTMGLRSELARLLGARVEDVVLIVEPHPRFGYLFGPDGRRRPPNSDRPPPGPPPPGPFPPEPSPPQGGDGPSPWPRNGFHHGGWFARQAGTTRASWWGRWRPLIPCSQANGPWCGLKARVFLTRGSGGCCCGSWPASSF